MKSKILLLLTAPVLVIIICSIVIYFSAHKLVGEPTSAPETLPQNVLEEPQNGSDAANEVKRLLLDVINASDVKIDFSPSVNAELTDSSLSEKQNKLLSFAVGKTGSAIAEDFYGTESYSSGYGKKPVLTEELLPRDNTAVGFEKTEGGDYAYSYSFNDAHTLLFGSEDEKMLAGIKARCAEFASVQSDAITAENGVSEVKITADPLTGRIKEITEDRSYVIKINDAEKAFSASFTLHAAGKFTVTFAGIAIEQDEIRIHGNGYDNLSITANVDENASQDDFSVVFVSSDPSVCTVDENGTVEAVKISDKPVTVTVTLTYLGKTYSDKCLVYVEPDDNPLFGGSGRIGSKINGKEDA